MTDMLSRIARRVSGIVGTVLLWIAIAVGVIATTAIALLTSDTGIAVWWRCPRCQRAGVWPIANIAHARTPCESSSADIANELTRCIRLAQPCVILYHDKWRKVRPYRIGRALKGSHCLVRALELSDDDGQYRTYYYDEIKLIARLPDELPYCFERKCYEPDNAIEPYLTAPTPEALYDLFEAARAANAARAQEDTHKKD